MYVRVIWKPYHTSSVVFFSYSLSLETVSDPKSAVSIEHEWQVEHIMNPVNTSLVQRSETLKQLDEMFYAGAEDLNSDP